MRKRTPRAKGKEEVRKQIIDDISPYMFSNPNPIKRVLKVKQFPWTDKQKEFFQIALHKDTRVIFVEGPAGTAKSLLSVYCGLQLLNMKVISDIMYLRSAVESSESKLGFLPGSAEDKLMFYNMPFIDKLDELLENTRIEKLQTEKRISMFPVNFARGMNWTNKCVILDEAQNSTVKEITTVLTRLGKETKCFVLADPMQTDLINIRLHGGFQHMYDTFSDEESQSMGIFTFKFGVEDIMRSDLCKFVIKKLRQSTD